MICKVMIHRDNKTWMWIKQTNKQLYYHVIFLSLMLSFTHVILRCLPLGKDHSHVSTVIGKTTLSSNYGLISQKPHTFSFFCPTTSHYLKLIVEHQTQICTLQKTMLKLRNDSIFLIIEFNYHKKIWLLKC